LKLRANARFDPEQVGLLVKLGAECLRANQQLEASGRKLLLLNRRRRRQLGICEGVGLLVTVPDDLVGLFTPWLAISDDFVGLFLTVSGRGLLRLPVAYNLAVIGFGGHSGYQSEGNTGNQGASHGNLLCGTG
jgi:hypothetical protein